MTLDHAAQDLQRANTMTLDAKQDHLQTDGTVRRGYRWRLCCPRELTFILLVGVALRAIVFPLFYEQPLRDDEIHYHLFAENLVIHGEFSMVAGEPISERPPLYPLMLAAIYSVFGIDAQNTVRIVQSLLGLATVVLVYHLGRQVYSKRVGLWSAGLYCFYPAMLASHNMILTETLFIFLLCLMCLLVFRVLDRPSVSTGVLIGIILGMSALTRSVTWLFPPVLAVFILLAARNVMWRRRLVLAVVPCVAFAVTIAPWAIRNTRLQSTFTMIETNGGRNFMMGHYEHTPLYRPWDAISLIDTDKSWGHVLSREEPDYEHATQGQRDKLALRRTLRYIVQHPGLTLQRTVVKFGHFWQLNRSIIAGAARGHWGHVSTVTLLGLAVVVCGSYAMTAILAIYGVSMTPANDRHKYWFCIVLILFICGIHTLVFAHARYRLPLMPLLFVFAASGLLGLRDVWSRRKGYRFRIASLVIAALVCNWGWQMYLDRNQLVQTSAGGRPHPANRLTQNTSDLYPSTARSKRTVTLRGGAS